MAEKPPQDAGMITTEQAARLLMISAERVRQLCKGGYIPRPSKGLVPLVGAVQGYVKFLKEEDRRSSKSAADSRVRDARAAEIELRIAERKRDLIPRAEAEAVLDALAGMVRQAFDGLAARVTRDLGVRRQIETAVHENLSRIADALEAGQRALETGGDDPATEPEEDA